MNELYITDDLRITTYDMGYKFEKRVITQRGDNIGEERWVDDGYYGKNIDSLMRRALDKLVHMKFPSTLSELRLVVEIAISDLKPIIAALKFFEIPKRKRARGVNDD